MADLLHGTWVPVLQRFFVWGETSHLRRPRGRQPTPPAHPFVLAPGAVSEVVARYDSGAAQALTPHTLTLWLPSGAHAPLPSPQMIASGAFTTPDETPRLAPWQVAGCVLPVSAAVDVLLALSALREPGADIRAWRAAALLALEVVAAQQVTPSLTRDGLSLRAAWRPRLAPQTAQKLSALARAMPPLCRAAASSPDSAPTARRLVDDFLAAAVDALVRDMTLTPPAADSTPGGKWLAALLGPDPVVNVKGRDADRLYQAYQTWIGQSQVAGDDAFRLTFRLEPPPTDTAAWTLTYLLQATDDPSLLVPVESIWRETGATFTYLERRFEQPQERVLTALGYAARLFPPLLHSLRSAAPNAATLSVDEAFTFLTEAAPLLTGSGFGVLVPTWWQAGRGRVQARARMKPNQKAAASGHLSLDTLVTFEWELAIGGEAISPAEFERLAALKVPLVQARGQWVVLDPAHLQAALQMFKRRQGQMTLAEALHLGLEGVAETGPQGVQVTGIEADGWLRDLLERLTDKTPLAALPAPAGLRAELRPYQARGYAWLGFMRQSGLGACLADDMGLGKTVQTIALLLREHEEAEMASPALIVCPTSVVGNWERELARFAPSLRLMVHRGATRPHGEDFSADAVGHDIVLTSYPLLARDRDSLESVEWSTAVLDEAQNIKNAATKQAQAARALRANNRVALTGTPVENRLGELWSIMAFLNPGYLGSEDTFRRRFARPIERTGDKKAAEQLRRLTGPFILRRLKTDRAIISDLPDKLEMKVYCSLTTEQATLYEAVVRDALQQIEAAEENPMQRRGLVLAMLMKLKQVCNHPSQFLKDGSAVAGRSGKLARLTEMLEEVVAEGDQALVFTQFAEMGQLLQDYLRDSFGDEVLFLHGGTRAKERDEMVRRFQAPQGPRLFILSLKAGGTGLNLTRANHVFHYDRWWNPAVENQATDRAFRIGQTRNVQVHKFICGGTLEDHIDQLIESKRALAESVLGAGEGWLTELSAEQLRDVVTLRNADIGE
ncbi:MAG: DEAD/DEAH box helicase [Anaerolineae bacterium]